MARDWTALTFEIMVGYRQVKSPKRNAFDLAALGNRPLPFCERNFPEFSIVVGFGQVSSQIKQIVDGGVSVEESLSLTYRLELSHPALSYLSLANC